MANSDPALEDQIRLVMLGVTMALFLVQAPIDLISRRLLRGPTLMALLVVCAMYLLTFVTSPQKSEISFALISSAILTCLTLGIHRASPTSLGFGDVLLVAPLSMAVAFTGIGWIAVWLLLASTTAAVHGAVSYLVSKERAIPFGPHLLGAASLVMLAQLESLS